MKITFKSLWCILAFCLPVLSAQAQVPAPNKPAKPLVFELKAPGQPTLHVIHTNNGIKVKEYPGKVILLNFWGKHCRWCMKEIPHLVTLQKTYKGKLQIIAIQAQGRMTPGEKSRLFQRFGFNYPIYDYEENPDFVRYISYRTDWQGGLPFSIIFDAAGNYVYKFTGYAPMEDLKRVIDFAIEHPGGK